MDEETRKSKIKMESFTSYQILVVLHGLREENKALREAEAWNQCAADVIEFLIKQHPEHKFP